MIDLVFPSGNEAQFIEMGKKLGWKNLCFGYEFGKEFKKKKIEAKKFDVKIAALADSKTLQAALGNPIVLYKADEDPIRILKQGKVDGIGNLEKFRITQVHCKFAKENEIAFCIGLANLLEQRNLNFWHRQARLVNKYKVPLILGSFAQNEMRMRSYHDLIALFNSIGFDKGLVKKGFEILNIKSA